MEHVECARRSLNVFIEARYEILTSMLLNKYRKQLGSLESSASWLNRERPDALCAKNSDRAKYVQKSARIHSERPSITSS